jgi:AraC family transcriptional regulator of arabinose operon
MANRVLDGSTYIELSLKECGREACIPDKIFEFTPKTYFLFHYIVSGKGTLSVGDETFHLHRGDLFYIAPGTHPRYTPDHDDPWTYLWLGFDGSAASQFLALVGLDETHPVYHDSEYHLKSYLDAIYNQFILMGRFDLLCLGQAYAFFGALCEKGATSEPALTPAQGHILAAKDFIYNNYQYRIGVNDIATNVGVTSNYLANIFASLEHSSPKKFLIEVRMRNAAIYLRSGAYKINEVGKKVGYPNPLHFSSEFKKFYGVSPLNYMKGKR